MNRIITVFFLFFCLSSLSATVMPPLLNSPVSLENLNDTEQEENPSVPETRDQKKRIPVKWGGSSLVQQEKEINGVKVTVYYLTGGAWIIHKKTKLSAGRIEIIGQDALKAYLIGGVKIIDMENNTVLTAAKGVYDKIEEVVNIEGSPLITFKNKNGETTIARSRLIKRHIPDSKTEMTDFIEIHNKDYTIISDKAIIHEKEDRIEIPQSPMIFGENIFMTGDSLVYTEGDGNITLKNHPVILQKGQSELMQSFGENDSKTVEKKENQKAAEKESISIATAEELVFHKKEEESWTGLFGKARIVNETTVMDADTIKTFGKENEKIEARNNISIHDKKGGILLKGNILDYDKPKNYAHLTDNISVEFLDKESGKTKSTMTAVELERFMDKNEVVARGDVEIKGENYIARGAYATYYEKEKKIHLEGNPSLEKDNKKMYSGRIIIYPDSNQLILSDGINLQTEE